jgi:hypothetical protein
MSTEIEIEKSILAIIESSKERIKSSFEESIAEVMADIMPHALSDTEMNISYRLEDAIRSILAGNFEYEDDYAVVNCSTGIVRARVKITDYEHDRLRKSLIEVMPECPKDLEIKSLRDQIKRLIEGIY